MPLFKDHLEKALSNREFLAVINEHSPKHYDWQVTVCFYTALHFVSAYASNFGLQYRSHSEIRHAINPANKSAASPLTWDAYIAYIALMSLSRRSRYLVLEGQTKNDPATQFTDKKHVTEAIRHLDEVLAWFETQHPYSVPKSCKMRCAGIPYDKPLVYFQIELLSD